LYERTKKELNQKLREQKEIHDKELRETQLRFNSLQQQYKILTTKHDDLEQHCSQVKKELSTENNDLKRKFDEAKAQYSKTQTSKDNDNAMWKVVHLFFSANFQH
jgi:DNA repair exonuclease SbcCD ATPase subunit